ncbi:MAG: nucleotidyltransferase family protein [Eubacteriales bacterium]|nr:nucleotidyltransferase family protein [Eubacteriales bacterium]MDD3882131.1 nucleotidyltransferase family protein [Eubacteriales bacterium]MDD4513236.1 nucleotidyltransferase family protein [Eubacteriales bacterium]
MINKSELALMDLSRAALLSEPVRQSAAAFDWDALIDLAERNDVLPLIARSTLSSIADIDASVRERLTRALNEARYLEAVQHFLIKELLAMFEGASVKYCMLKGWGIKEFYPAPMLRDTCDVDILIEPDSWDAAVLQAEKAGFAAIHDIDLHLVMLKNDVVLELHRSPLSSRGKYFPYFSDVWSRMLRLGETCEYKMTALDEQMLFYLHMDKHIMCYSFKLRFLCDIAALRRAGKWRVYADGFDRNSRKAGIYYMQKHLCEISDAWISGNKYTARQEEILGFLADNVFESESLTLYRKAMQSLKGLLSPHGFFSSMNPPRELLKTFSDYSGMSEREKLRTYRHSVLLKIKGAYQDYASCRKSVTREEKKRNRKGIKLLYGK